MFRYDKSFGHFFHKLEIWIGIDNKAFQVDFSEKIEQNFDAHIELDINFLQIFNTVCIL